MSDEFSFLIDDSMLLDASDVAIGRVRPSETIRTWNDSELKSIVSGGGGGGIGEGNGSESAAIVAICEGRGALSEIGFSIFDTQSNVCHIIQYSDTSNYSRTMHLLTIHPPLRILMCSSATENHRSKLYQTLLDVFPLDSLCFLTRSDFNEGKGREVIERLCVPKLLDGVMFGCTKKYYAYSAVSALFYFLENELSLTLSPRSLKFQVKPSDGTLSLDYHTCKSLELVSNGSDPRSQQSLLGVLCKSQTAMGRRLMRTSLLQPLTDLIEINERQEAIQLLLEHEVELQELRESLKRFPDIDKFISSLVRRENVLDPKCGEELIHRALLLKKILSKTSGLLGTLKRLGSTETSCTLISSIVEVLSDEGIEAIGRMIEEVINEDISYSEKTNLQHHQRFYAVKSSVT